MNRIKLADRSLPTYSRAEEWFNAISHMAGGAFGIAALVLCLVKSALLRSAFGVVSSVVYGLSLILLYACSSVYHATARSIFSLPERTPPFCSAA